MVDERTGEARFAPAVGGVSGPAGSGLELKAQFSQQLSSAGVNRFGLGQGVTLGLPFVDVDRGVVVLPGGEQVMDDSAESGFKNYKLSDVRFGADAARSPVEHAYVLESFRDGAKQYFNGEGDLVGVQDRHGHITELAWEVVNSHHRLMSATSGWGSKLTVAYKGSTVKFISPKRWRQEEAPTTHIELSQSRIKSVVDAAGRKSGIEWATRGNGVAVPSAVVSPTGARTLFEYREYEPRSGSVLAVAKFEVRRADGSTILDPVQVSLDPDGANGGRNYTGCPQYCSDGTDRLENSGDAAFSYRVRFRSATGQEVERTYNALHLKQTEVNRIRKGSGTSEISRSEFSYPGGSEDASPPKLNDAPPNYQLPSLVKVTVTDPDNPSRTRSSEVAATFDAMGRTIRQTHGDVEINVEYGPNSIPVRTETRDRQTGARQVIENTLTSSGNAVAKTTKRAARKASDALTTVEVREFEYQTGQLAGEVKRSTVTGDPAAKDGDSSPAITTFDSTIEEDDEGVGRRVSVVNQPGGVKTTTVSDLASGASLSEKVGDLNESTTQYDIADRPTKETASDGSTNVFTYDAELKGDDAGKATAVSVRRESDGFSSRTISDELGRPIMEMTNYKPSANAGRGEILAQGQWRQISAAEYDGSGQLVKRTDAGGRETVTTYDAWGKPAETTNTGGAITRTSHDDVAGTNTVEALPAGADKPTVTTTESYDDQGNTKSAETSYGDASGGGRLEMAFNAFGEQTRTQDSDQIVDHSYALSGTLEAETLHFAGNDRLEARADHEADAFGNKTHKTLTQGNETAGGWVSEFDAAGRPRQMSAPGGGGSLSIGYNPVNGLVDSKTGADGTVTHQRRDASGRVVESWVSPKGRAGDREQHVRASYDPATGMVAAR
ncbi:hypothetical protein, partial [Streptomyces cyaneofuscatus]|uniref:hypothetical protein n=1 Tax=Streptomyces cyaneofuscatus TaxID=66883 RepID=UPI003818B1F3